MKSEGRIKVTQKVKTTKSVGRTTKAIGGRDWEGLFASRTLARLLTTFLTHAEKDFYQRELADLVGAGLYTVQRALARLEKLGLVTKMPRGNRAYYRANRKSSVFEDLKRVILKTLGLGGVLRTSLASLADRVQVAFIYGSFARGEETEASDVDILIVGNLSLKEAAAVLGPVGRRLGREFNTTVYPIDEFKAKNVQGNHFISEILKGDKLFLIGDERELERTTG
ncbi:MAG: nucleotidyltransferase domain-containing protein [Candidatus Brocadiia bacterium]